MKNKWGYMASTDLKVRWRVDALGTSYTPTETHIRSRAEIVWIYSVLTERVATEHTCVCV